MPKENSMKKRKLASIILTLLALLVVLPTAVKADSTPAQVKKIQEAGVLKVGVKQDVPNFG